MVRLLARSLLSDADGALAGILCHYRRLSYVLANALAAFLFCLGGPDTIANSDGSFWHAFFFSVQTSASIGYGAMTPATAYANALVTLEAIVSILGIAVLTGLAYARFARPTASGAV